MESNPLSEELLLRQGEFLRRLASGLLHDRDQAEDARQEAWLGALESRARGGGPRSQAQAPGWWARIARNAALRWKRSGRRRAEHEASAAAMRSSGLGDPGATPVDALARTELLSVVADAVRSLDEPYRSTILARYYDDWEPTRIAKNQGVSVATVKSRHARALGKLRDELDRRGGGGAQDWRFALAPLAPLASPSGAASTASLVLAAGKGLAAAAVLAVATWLMLSQPWRDSNFAPAGPDVAWIRPPDAPADDRGEALVNPAPSFDGTPQASTDRRPAASGTESPHAGIRTAGDAAEAQDEAPKGASLALRVVDARGAPCARVSLLATPWDVEHPGLRAWVMTTGPDGRASAFDLPVGRVTLHGDRGGGEATTLVAGEMRELVITLPEGTEVQGRVVDADGRPVRDALVFVQAALGACTQLPVARSAADGSFVVHDVLPGAWLSAEAAAGESPLTPLVGLPGTTASIDLVLNGPAAAMNVRVRMPDGQPAAGACVQVTAARHREHELRTDDTGRAAFERLAPGLYQVWTMWPPLGARWVELELRAGEVRALDLDLARASALVGRVTDREGHAVADARITVELPADPAGFATRSDAQGWYRLEGLPALALTVRAQHDRAGKAQAALTLLPGERLTWDASLDPGRTVRGRVVDARGVGLADWRVRVLASAGPDRESWDVQDRCDPAGDFSLTDLRSGPLDLEVYDPDIESSIPVHVVRAIESQNRVEWRIRIDDSSIPKAHIHATLIDSTGAVRGGLVQLFREDAPGLRTAVVSAADGRLHLGPLMPGDYRLWCEFESAVLSLERRFRLGAEDLDLGRLVLAEGGHFRARVVTANGYQPPADLRVCVTADSPFGCFGARARVYALDEPIGPWCEGDYLVSLVGGDVAFEPTRVRAVSNTEVEVVLVASAGIPISVRPRWLDPTEAPPAVVQTRIRDGAGSLLVDTFQPSDASEEFVLSPGEYTIEIQSATRRGETRLRLEARALSEQATTAARTAPPRREVDVEMLPTSGR